MMRLDIMLRRLIKKRRFLKQCSLGLDTIISEYADCSSDLPGMITIGDHCEIAAKFISQAQGKIICGNNTWIGGGTVIGSVNRIEIGDHVMISTDVHIYDNNNHPTDPMERIRMFDSSFHSDSWRWKHSASAPVWIQRNVWIGERATILKGVTVGEGSIIGASSVVTHDIPPNCIAAGNPAVVVKYLIPGEVDAVEKS